MAIMGWGGLQSITNYIIGMGVDENIQKKLGIPILNIIQSQSQDGGEGSLSITNIFDARKFIHLVFNFVPKAIDISIPSENNLQFAHAWNVLKQAAQQLKIQDKDQFQPDSHFLQLQCINFQEETISEDTWKNLKKLCRVLFQIMLKNENVLYLITKMQEKHQIQIKQYIEKNEEQRIECKIESDSPTMSKSQNKFGTTINMSAVHDQKLYERIQQMEHAIGMRDQQLSKLRQKQTELKDELSLVKNVLQEKQNQIVQLKGRMAAYSEADVLFQQKDQQISKLTAELNEYKIKSLAKTSQLNSQILKLKQKVHELQQQKAELTASNQQLSNKNQVLTSNKEEAERANKKVIVNLKQKIKGLNDKIAEQQKSLMNVLMQKQEKDKQIFELQKKVSSNDPVKKTKFLSKHEDIRHSARKSSKLVDQIGDLSDLSPDQDNDLKEYFQALFGQIGGRCTGQLCISLRSEYVRIVQQIIAITNDSQSLSYLTPQNRLQCIINQLTKIQQACHENLKLKQKLVLQSEGVKGLASKQSIEQINKLKKKLLVMKRNLEEVEAKRKEELQILVSALGEKFSDAKI